MEWNGDLTVLDSELYTYSAILTWKHDHHRYGMEWEHPQIWNGMGTPTDMEWNGNIHRYGMEWEHPQIWNGMGTPTDMEWNGNIPDMEWNGNIPRYGMEWRPTCIGSWTCSAGMSIGSMSVLYSCILQSSATSRTRGRINGIILWLRNSSAKGGSTCLWTTR